MKIQPGKIVIISSPSGGGKTSICNRLLSPTRKRQGWKFSISYTTRNRRRGERNGREYFFVSEPDFKKLVAKDFFAEHFKVHLYRYGTPRQPLEEVVHKGGVMLLDVDVQGAFKLRRVYPQAVTIFVQPPSIVALKRRLTARGTETKEQLKVRFENAIEEMKLFSKFDYVVINQDLDVAVEEVLHIIASAHCRTTPYRMEQINRLLS
jgi:guanylate kinase